MFSHSNQTWLAAQTFSSVRFRLITRVGAGTSSIKCRFGSRDTEPQCMLDCLSFSSHMAWQDQFLPCSFQQWVDSVTCIVIIQYYTQVYCSPCSHPQLENLSPVQTTKQSSVRCFAHPVMTGRSPLAVGRLTPHPEDSSFSIKARLGNPDRTRSLADLPERFFPAAALHVASMEINSVALVNKSCHLASFTDKNKG